MRAVIYARYSSENQREASIDDQIEICRRYAEARGWTVTERGIVVVGKGEVVKA